jgi:hypothetical protein
VSYGVLKYIEKTIRRREKEIIPYNEFFHEIRVAVKSNKEGIEWIMKIPNFFSKGIITSKIPKAKISKKIAIKSASNRGVKNKNSFIAVNLL